MTMISFGSFHSLTGIAIGILLELIQKTYILI